MPRGPHPGKGLRRIFAIDERESVVRFAQSSLGRATLFFSIVALMLSPLAQKGLWLDWRIVPIIAALFAHAYLPKYRGVILFAGAWAVTFSSLPVSLRAYAAQLSFLLFAWCAITVSYRHKKLFLARRPVISLLCGCALLGLATVLIPHGAIHDGIWSFLVAYSGAIWFLCYAIVDQRSKDRSSDLVQMGMLPPFWVTSATPIGKGAAFLRKYLAKSPYELAVTQIKGLKLLVWMSVLIALILLLKWATHRLAIPTAGEALAAFAGGKPFSTGLAWTALLLDVTFAALWTAIWGHKIIGLARLAGFRLPRNMCRPLESHSIADYWNRYYYYFKELLVEFFYVPTFMKTFRNHTRLRIFFATFMAAGVGNAIFHFVRDFEPLSRLGATGAFAPMSSYAFCCAVLATGIGISQLRAHAGFKPSYSWAGRVKSFVVVWGFMVSIHIFDYEAGNNTLVERLGFVASLFWIS